VKSRAWHCIPCDTTLWLWGPSLCAISWVPLCRSITLEVVCVGAGTWMAAFTCGITLQRHDWLCSTATRRLCQPWCSMRTARSLHLVLEIRIS
jgi:hypothetical protein